MEQQRDDNRRITLKAEKARQGYIALKTPARKWVFFGGLAAFVLLMIFLTLVAGA